VSLHVSLDTALAAVSGPFRIDDMSPDVRPNDAFTLSRGRSRATMNA
jgi:hypothetical protein